VELPRCSSCWSWNQSYFIVRKLGALTPLNQMRSLSVIWIRTPPTQSARSVNAISRRKVLRDRQIYSPGSAVSEGGAKQQCSAVGLVVLRKIEDSQKKLARTRGPPILPLKHAFATSQKSRGERQSSLSNFTAAQQTNNDASLSCFCGAPSHVQPC
jgi:hypothetical protein